MLLCEKCLEKYKISCSLEACVITYGNCEECKLTRRCYDVPHDFCVKRPIIFNPSRRGSMLMQMLDEEEALFNLEIDNPKVLKVIHSPSLQCHAEPCIECLKYNSIIFLVIDEKRNVNTRIGCMQEVFMCPDCFYFFFVGNPSKRGEPYH